MDLTEVWLRPGERKDLRMCMMILVSFHSAGPRDGICTHCPWWRCYPVMDFTQLAPVARSLSVKWHHLSMSVEWSPAVLHCFQFPVIGQMKEKQQTLSDGGMAWSSTRWVIARSSSTRWVLDIHQQDTSLQIIHISHRSLQFFCFKGGYFDLCKSRENEKWGSIYI